MSEKPIIFSGPMVRAILEGRKTMTRRVLKPQPILDDYGKPLPFYPKCAVGDRLWVREAWRSASPLDDASPRELGEELGFPPIHYEADGKAENWTEWRGHDVGRLRPSIHMPRWASRITLDVKAVKVERLQDISEEDAEAEGCDFFGDQTLAYKGKFAALWDEIHGTGAWDVNPWVAVISFERVT